MCATDGKVQRRWVSVSQWSVTRAQCTWSLPPIDWLTFRVGLQVGLFLIDRQVELRLQLINWCARPACSRNKWNWSAQLAQKELFQEEKVPGLTWNWRANAECSVTNAKHSIASIHEWVEVIYHWRTQAVSRQKSRSTKCKRKVDAGDIN